VPHLVYLIKNQVNNKVYVGKTSVPISIRWSQHVYCANHGVDRYLYNAMRKHGKDQFSIETLNIVDTELEANNLERLWIIALNSKTNVSGYNLTFGGDGCSGYIHPIGKKRRKKVLRNPQEFSQKMREIRIGTHLSENAKKKLSTFNTSEERLKKSRVMKAIWTKRREENFK
jgi:group I intron endonuclease